MSYSDFEVLLGAYILKICLIIGLSWEQLFLGQCYFKMTFFLVCDIYHIVAHFHIAFPGQKAKNINLEELKRLWLYEDVSENQVCVINT